MRITYAAIVIIAMILPIIVPQSLVQGAETRLFWADAYAGKIQHARLDGTDVRDLIFDESQPWSFDIDQQAQKIYWASNGNGEIRRANLDGTQSETLITGLSNPLGIAIDPGRGKLYFTDQHGGTVGRANLDGSQPEILISGRTFPSFLAVDRVEGYLYWSDASNPQLVDVALRRSRLDGSGLETFAPGIDAVQVDFDYATNRVYWVNQLTGLNRKRMTGTRIENVPIYGSLLSFDGFVFDFPRNKMYIADHDSGKVFRTNLDGTAVTEVARGLQYVSYLKVATIVPEPSTFSAILVVVVILAATHREKESK